MHLSSMPPPARRILILAPHMDDELIGCAGLTAWYVERGARVVCVYLTDGAGGRTGSERESYTAERRRESEMVCRQLGIQRQYYLERPDGRLAANPALIGELKRIIGWEAPQLLLLPYPNDPHPDHRAAASVAAGIFRKRPAGLTILYYQLRSPIPLEEIDLAVDTGSFFDAKRELLYGYRSQARFPFDLALHLQQCQGVLLDHKPAAAEVFSKADPEHLAEFDGGGPPVQIVRHLQVGWYALHRRRERG